MPPYDDDPKPKPGEPQDPFTRYAYGFSDRKPNVAAWLILLTMAGVALYSCVRFMPE